MPIYFNSAPTDFPFQFDSIGNNWNQEPTLRPDGFPVYHYLQTQEGRMLPVEHCIRGTYGWEIREEIAELLESGPIDKPTFGSETLGKVLKEFNKSETIDSITLVGLCTDICVISNAMLLKAFLPEVPIMVDSLCCAGVTPESHERALEAMKACQIEVL